MAVKTKERVTESGPRVFKKEGQLMAAFRRMKKQPMAVISMAAIALLILLAIFADVLYDYTTDAIGLDLGRKLLPCSSDNLLGTDQYGRDLAARIVHGVRTALLMGIVASFITLFTATVLACIASYFGGIVDMIIMRILDVMASIPSILIAMALCAGLGNGMWQLIVALGVGNIAGHTRMLRSRAISVSRMEYVESAVALGARTPRIIFKYIVPNIISLIIIQFTGSVSGNILMGATLSFVGLGVKVPRPEWGIMLSEGILFMGLVPRMIIAPGIALVFTALFINTFGDCLRDALDPQLKGKA